MAREGVNREYIEWYIAVLFPDEVQVFVPPCSILCLIEGPVL
jgi:hypothetical protein